jgi:putative ATPase
MSTRVLPYDKEGDVHYDVISAFIKSMRGSDPDAAVYWLARMVHGGEDPKFIARRMLIFASEDIGMADPQALLIAHAAFKAAESVGWPEARINLAHAAIYLALAPKSNAAYRAIEEALADVREGAAQQVPEHLRDRHRPGAERYPAYKYPHDYPDARIEQQYLPDGLEGRRYYRPRGPAAPASGTDPGDAQ